MTAPHNLHRRSPAMLHTGRAASRLTLAIATALALSAAATGAPAYAAEPPSVQVVMPVVDGGVTVVVSPGTPAAPVQAAPPAPAPLPAPAAPVYPAQPSAPQTWPAPTAPAPPAPVAPAPLQTRPVFPQLPTATPTYVTPGPASVPSSGSPTASAGPATAAPGSSAPTQASTPTAQAGQPAPAQPAAAGGAIKLGVFGHSTDRTVRFQEKMGRPVDIVSVFPARGSWDTIMDTWWLDRAPQGFTGTLDVGVPLWQEDGDLATAAQGGYNAQWEELGRVIHAKYPGSSVRIGWEFNLGGWKHHATDENVEQWKEAFRHASTSLKKGGPSLLVNWNPNKGKGDSLGDASKAWPGGDVVDIVGLDAYDWWPAYSESTWPEHRDGDQGWKYWVDFARSHGKQFSAPEWGVAPGNDHGGGDNPYYIGVVMDYLLAEHAKDGIVHSVVYFDETEAYIANSIADGQVPLAGAALAERVKNLGAAAPRSATPTAGGAPPPPTPEGPKTDGPHAGANTEPAPQDSPTEGEGDKHDGDQEERDSGAAGATEKPSPPADEPKKSGDAWGAADGHGPVPR